MAEPGNGAEGAVASPGKKERIRKFLLDLTSLEVTTLVTTNITGETMPEPREAVAKLGAQYASKLGTIARSRDDAGGGPEAAFGGSVSDAVASGTGGPHPLDFGTQGRMAESLLSRQGAGMTDADQGHLARIRANTEPLDRLAAKLGVQKASTAAVLQAPTEGDASASRLAPEEMVALRKMWELGTESIALQTVIQAGGDLITRIHPDHASGTQPVLLDLHRIGIETAVGIWRSLVDTAVQILEKIFDR